MAAPHEHLELAASFPATGEDEWRELAAEVLRRAGRDADDPSAALTTRSYDDIALRPLYVDAPAGPRIVPARPQWDVRARLCDTDAARVNRAALAELESGSTSLWLIAGAAGLAVEDLRRALDGVRVELAPIALDAGERTAAAAAELLALGDGVHGSLGADPIGLHATTGAGPDLGVLAELAGYACAGLCLASVDATVYHDAGASDADELGIAVAVGVAYLRALTDAGLSVDDAFAALEFRFAVTADEFASIAKLRAARQLWARVAELCGASDGRQRQHAVTSAAMTTRRDPYVNMVRTTIAAFAAAVGGADAVTVLPFDHALGRPDDLARRIARNTNAILHDESSLGRVADAAGGSWFVETYTAELAEHAWQTFTALERAGGAVDGFDTITARIAATRERRDADVAHRRATLVGVSEYAQPDEAALERDDAPPPRTGGSLTLARWAAPFERLRSDAGDTVVFLATLGRPSAHAARVEFARNLYTAGGFGVIVGSVDEFAGSGARVACLCGTDEVYDSEGADAVAALRAAGAVRVVIAGHDDAGSSADAQISRGCDALAELGATLEAAR